MQSTDDFPVAVLISGGGTTLGNLILQKQLGNLPVDFKLVISSRSDAAGLKIASDAGIPTQVVSRTKKTEPDEFSRSVFEPIRKTGSQLVVMAGYLQHVLIPDDFSGKVINIHPSLIPAFCGPGMYGLRVHQAVIDFGARVTGCTVHYVDNQYDHGPIIDQRSCQVYEGDTAENLQKRVFQLECQALPEVIRVIAAESR